MKMLIKAAVFLILIIFPGLLGALATPQSFGDVTTNITNSFTSVARLITALSYIGGLAFAIVAVMKFKQHKDNPTQVSVGQALGQACIATIFLFLPSFLGYLGGTLFGNEAQTSGPTGQVYCSNTDAVYSADSCGK
ncbi:Component of the Dot/Icm secretion system. Predicted innermembrane protein [Legionella hackeliae]|uniref:Component of the Dot/Icm secretion system. Predicted innermembrane protein n=2 Tax=Legionella hackeliae TaxID=449 RepID=A0A0A8URQ9_LEGHA|nr:Component of the Dot/Icm secretion system. Predicted innermembrane protein [Legionella hackeliae]